MAKVEIAGEMKVGATIAGLVTIVTMLAPAAHADDHGYQGDGSGPNYAADLLDMGVPGSVTGALIMGGTICVKRQDGVSELQLANVTQAAGVDPMAVLRGEYHFCPTEMAACEQTVSCPEAVPEPAVLAPGQTRPVLPAGDVPVYVS